MRSVTAAPALVAVVVVRITAGACIRGLHDHAAALADTVAFNASAITIPHGSAGALNLIASPAATSVLRVGVSEGGNVPAGTLVGPLIAKAAACKIRRSML